MISAGRHPLFVVVLVLALAFGGNARGQSTGDADWADEWEDASSRPVEIHGYAEAAVSGRVVEDPTQPHEFLLNEARFRLDLAHYGDRASVYVKGDFVSDGVTDEVVTDLRQAAIALRASGWLDVRAGRQVLTWGTGDLVFLNDLFPKDFVSFFTGREDEYLKAPSNAVKLTVYSGAFDADVVWTPVFEPDRYITGERLSFFSAAEGRLVSAPSADAALEAVAPNRKAANGELAARVFRNVRGYELALYGYSGFTKQPLGFDPDRDAPVFSPLSVYGGSVRLNVAGGVASVEGAYRDSRDDREGNDPNVPNSRVLGLAGFERELFANFTSAFQFYAEWTRNHDEQLANSPRPELEAGEVRQILTNRITYRLRRETLILGSFVFYSPDDRDGYVRPSAVYKLSDAVALTAGANVLFGEESTFFGQLENNTNVYMRLRYNF